MSDQRAFSGVKVLDLTRVLAGPFCAYQLALLGAEVIKIEPPGKGETVRWRSEAADPSFGQQGLSLGFMTQSSNKRFLSLDLNKAEGRDIFLKLAAECDVVVQNLRSGSAQCFGVNAGPEQGEVADLAVDLLPGCPNSLSGFRHHFSDRHEWTAGNSADPMNHIGANETDKQVGDVVDQGWINNAQFANKSALGEAGEIVSDSVIRFG